MNQREFWSFVREVDTRPDPPEVRPYRCECGEFVAHGGLCRTQEWLQDLTMQSLRDVFDRLKK